MAVPSPDTALGTQGTPGIPSERHWCQLGLPWVWDFPDSRGFKELVAGGNKWDLPGGKKIQDSWLELGWSSLGWEKESLECPWWCPHPGISF